MATDTPAPKPRKPRATAAKTAATSPKAGASARAAAAEPAAARTPVSERIAATGETLRTEATRKASEISEEMARLYAQASERTVGIATQGKDKVAGGLNSLAKAIDDSAASVDDRLGSQYGDFARSAATTVAGLAGSLEQQDLDELVASTRDFVKKSPAVAIGSAAVVGFMLARLMRGSNNN